jgi:hypothetical protein
VNPLFAAKLNLRGGKGNSLLNRAVVLVFFWPGKSATFSAMSQSQPLFLCMGSACHQRRGYVLLPALEQLIRRHDLAGRLEIKGAFCLDNCQHGCSLKFGGRVIPGVNEQNLTEIFEREILPLCQPH